MTIRRGISILAIVLIVAAIWWRNDESGKNGAAHTPPAVNVSMVKVRQEAAPVQLSAMGTIVSPHIVSVRAQVNGNLAEVYFKEGETVSQGQKLFLIDPSPYQAAVDQARGQLARDRAAAASARAQRDRLAPLMEKDYVTPQEFEDARAAATEAEALTASDAAALRNAQINLDRTLIRAPISGRTGSLSVKSGNIVSIGDANPLIVINRVDKVEVEFSVPQDELPSIQTALADGPVAVQIRDEHAEQSLGNGKLSFVDNAIDAATGTVRLKAEADNAENRLWPGAFVSVTVVLRVQTDALLVPETAVQPGAEGPYVYVVTADGKAELRNVVIDRQIGSDVVVSNGLQAGDSIVAKAPRGLSPGMTVSTVAAPKRAPTKDNARDTRAPQ